MGDGGMESADRGLRELRFFGKITASVSHELKNYLALINEYNGLLSDLIVAHEMGRDLDLARLKSICGDVHRQVVAGGQVLDHLNGFAHSVDEQVRELDLGAHLALFVALSRRPAALKGVSLELAPAQRRVLLATRPYALLWALGLCLERCLAGAASGGRLGLGLALRDGRPALEFSGEKPPSAEPDLPAGLLADLGAELAVGATGLALVLPEAPA